ncbi:Trypsin-1 [Orchesella cincta]|uniref:Trypsin-1 n=1 Tax=Orchesella cincta TaxID=48709 RepID=A0A1D2N316_ORCCI|nr:Trypsin-1 [Orchesella cincta]
METIGISLLLVLGFISKIEADIQINSYNNAGTNVKIVGGEPAYEGEFPYQVRLHYNNQFLCGGSFITVKNKHFVLTAAHCFVYSNDPKNYKVFAGDLKMSDITGNEQIRQVTRIFIHEEYRSLPNTIKNDIALLLINEPFHISDFVSPINLPRQDQSTSGTLVVTGWGRLNSYRSNTDTLQKVEIDLVSDPLCGFLVPAVRYTPKNSTLCGGLFGGKAPCNGDGGVLFEPMLMGPDIWLVLYRLDHQMYAGRHFVLV